MVGCYVGRSTYLLFAVVPDSLLDLHSIKRLHLNSNNLQSLPEGFFAAWPPGGLTWLFSGWRSGGECAQTIASTLFSEMICDVSRGVFGLILFQEGCVWEIQPFDPERSQRERGAGH